MLFLIKTIGNLESWPGISPMLVLFKHTQPAEKIRGQSAEKILTLRAEPPDRQAPISSQNRPRRAILRA